MATYAGIVASIRRLLQDFPQRAQLGAAITDTTTATMTVASADAGKFQVGQLWEHDDNNGSTSSTSSEQRLITAISGTTVTGERGFTGSTAATHLISTYLNHAPRFSYDRICQAVDAVLESDLYINDVFEVVEHTVTSSASTYAYNAPSTSCERILEVYQRVNSTDVKTAVDHFLQYSNVDTSLWSNGKVYAVYGVRGVLGTDSFYINCAHKLAVTTLSAAQQNIVEYMACYYLMSWAEIPRTAGPTNQGDRSVRPMDQARLAAWFEQQARRLMREEAAYLKAQTKRYRRFVRN